MRLLSIIIFSMVLSSSWAFDGEITSLVFYDGTTVNNSEVLKVSSSLNNIDFIELRNGDIFYGEELKGAEVLYRGFSFGLPAQILAPLLIHARAAGDGSGGG